MTLRKMTETELEGYEGSVYGYVLDTDEFESRLWAAPDGSGKRWMLYGDLRPAFGLGDGFGDEGDQGNHTVEQMIEGTAGYVAFKERVTLDSENSTFFAYMPDTQTAVDFADYIAGFVAERREVATGG